MRELSNTNERSRMKRRMSQGDDYKEEEEI